MLGRREDGLRRDRHDLLVGPALGLFLPLPRPRPPDPPRILGFGRAELGLGRDGRADAVGLPPRPDGGGGARGDDAVGPGPRPLRRSPGQSRDARVPPAVPGAPGVPGARAAPGAPAVPDARAARRRQAPAPRPGRPPAARAAAPGARGARARRAGSGPSAARARRRSGRASRSAARAGSAPRASGSGGRARPRPAARRAARRPRRGCRPPGSRAGPAARSSRSSAPRRAPAQCGQTWLDSSCRLAPQPLARQLHQAELADLAHLDAGAVGLQRVAQPLLDRALVAALRHVDEVDHDQAGEVAQAELAGDLVGGLEVGLDAPSRRCAARGSSGRS